ncbi:MAG: PhzF family phenazine biosynthesis protein [Candidatus Krumholzibacteria bacterium]|nr:PhzF family phenazine biosynthesis protein [Candidatus Krumholzibacteria bacterium]
MPKELKYDHVDVFTDKPLGGNQLAVFHAPGQLASNQMLAIAREINFSETTFVFPSKTDKAIARVRIFTPTVEIPFAGHPVIGTAFVIATRSRKILENIVLELGVGPITVDIERHGKKIQSLKMHQPLPAFGSALQNREQAARALGVTADDVLGGGVVSNGLDFLVVEATTLRAVQDAQCNSEDAIKVIKRHNVHAIYMFARLQGKGPNVHARLFTPTSSVVEDPATGSAAGALGGYLARILKFPMKLRLTIEQGIEVHRPSLILVDVNSERGTIEGVAVSGKVVAVGDGTIRLH